MCRRCDRILIGAGVAIGIGIEPFFKENGKMLIESTTTKADTASDPDRWKGLADSHV
jgi:hypothetical protein